MPNRIEAAQRKPSHVPPGGYSHCACSRLHIKKGAPQKGQPESCRSRTRAMVCRSVAMDQGLCRSTRTGRTPRAELERHFGDG